MDFPRLTNWMTGPIWGQIRLDLIGGGRIDGDANWGTGGYAISERVDRYYVIEQGWIELEQLGHHSRFEAGQVVIAPGGVASRWSGSTDLVLGWVHARCDLMPGVSLFSRQPQPRCCDLDRSLRQHWRALLAAVGAGYAPAQSPQPPAALTGLAGLLGLLAEMIDEPWRALLPPDDAMTRFAPVLEAIAAAPEHPWRSATLADMLGWHATTFANRFSAAFGCGPREHVIRVRLARACELLRAADCSIAEVAEACGFNDPFYFSRLFRRRVGVPPSAYATLSR